MEVKLIYNPVEKNFYIYKDKDFITDTISEIVAIDTFLLYKERANKEVDVIAESYKQVSKIYLDTANSNFEMEV